MIRPPEHLGVPANSQRPIARPTALLSDTPPTGRLVLVGFFTVLVFILMAAGWSATANISSAAIGQGVVVMGSERRQVQHLEGGIVAEILVRDGDHVSAGQPLVVLDTTRTQSGLDGLETQLVAALALEARLLAERDGAEALQLPALLEERRTMPEVQQVVVDHTSLLVARRLERQERHAIIGRRIAQAEAEIAGIESELTAQRRQLSLLQEQLAGLASLLERGLTAKSRFYELSRAEAALIGDIEGNTARVAATRQAIAAYELEILEFERSRASEVATALPEVRERKAMLTKQIAAAGDVVRRAVIRAPIAGNVVNLRTKTIGAVIQGGAPVLDIVPSSGPLLVEARIDPKDRDMLEVGQSAQVRFMAFSQRTVSRVSGRLISISADRLQESPTTPPYFLAKIQLDADEVDKVLGGLGSLHPGMQAETLIVTGERSVLGYLMRPITHSLDRALREQ